MQAGLVGGKQSYRHRPLERARRALRTGQVANACLVSHPEPSHEETARPSIRHSAAQRTSLWPRQNWPLRLLDRVQRGGAKQP